jgi:uncharacterized membrane protein SpoIIM required for sporulation
VAGRDQFVFERRSRWEALEQILARGPLQQRGGSEISRAAGLYRSACADLMRARAQAFGADVTGYLDALVSRGHSALYGPRPYSVKRAVKLLLEEFPRTLRANVWYFVAAFALFTVPLVAGYLLAYGSESFAYDVMPRSALEQAEKSFSQDLGTGRDIGTNSFMAGFYVQNNVGIAFRCFATGALFGAGSIFFLFYNGLDIGTTVGFVVRHGAGANMFTFMCGHSPFELTAIVISGAAGLMLGAALVAPGGRTRWGALRETAVPVGNLVLGAAAFLLVAAMIEGYWSPTSIAPPVKWAFSAVGWTAVFLFLTFAGRRSTP